MNNVLQIPCNLVRGPEELTWNQILLVSHTVGPLGAMWTNKNVQ